MTDDRMALIELVEKQADGDVLRAMLAFAAEMIMEAEVEERTGAARGARSPLREGERNAQALDERLNKDKDARVATTVETALSAAVRMTDQTLVSKRVSGPESLLQRTENELGRHRSQYSSSPSPPISVWSPPPPERVSLPAPPLSLAMSSLPDVPVTVSV